MKHLAFIFMMLLFAVVATAQEQLDSTNIVENPPVAEQIQPEVQPKASEIMILAQYFTEYASKVAQQKQTIIYEKGPVKQVNGQLVPPPVKKIEYANKNDQKQVETLIILADFFQQAYRAEQQRLNPQQKKGSN